MTSGDQWESCPQGLLHGMARQQRMRRRRQRLARVAFSLGFVVLIVAGYAAIRSPGPQGTAESLTCREATVQFAGYHEGTLDGAARAALEQHLARCPHCRQAYEARFPEEAADRDAARSARLAVREGRLFRGSLTLAGR